MKYQEGYTIVELVVAIAGILSLALILTGTFVLVHFIMKFW